MENGIVLKIKEEVNEDDWCCDTYNNLEPENSSSVDVKSEMEIQSMIEDNDVKFFSPAPSPTFDETPEMQVQPVPETEFIIPDQNLAVVLAPKLDIQHRTENEVQSDKEKIINNVEETSIAKKRTRRPNFSSEELKALVEGAVKRKIMINGSSNPLITGPSKLSAWDAISKEVNAISIHKRTVQELRIKLKTFKAEAKREVASYIKELMQTGRGGPPPKRPSVINESVVDLIGKTALQGIDMGLEVGGLKGQTMTCENCKFVQRDLRINHKPDLLAEPVQPAEPVEQVPVLIEYVEFIGVGTAPEKENKACQTVSQGSTSLLQQGDLMLAALNRIGNLLQLSLEKQAEANAQQAENGRMIAATLAAVSGLLHINHLGSKSSSSPGTRIENPAQD